MKYLFRPIWTFSAVTLPQLLLFGAGVGTYRIIESLLTDQQRVAWAVCGGLLALSVTGFTALALAAALARRPLPARLGPLLLLVYLPFLVAVGLNVHEIVPPSIPRWMFFHGDQLLLVYTLTMPAFIHGLLLTVTWLTPEETVRSAGKNFAVALALPLGWYLLGVGGWAAWQGRTLSALLPYLAILSAVAFLFFLVRTAVIVLANQAGVLRRHRLLWLIVVCLVFPQLGLALHGGFLPGGSLPKGLFGDFSDPAFFLLAAVNGVLLCLPIPHRTVYRWVLAVARALLLPFTAYFFLVFLPYFPLSLFAVFAVGVGFLMLTPLFLALVHARALREDFAFLRSSAGAARSAAALGAAALVLPALIAAGCLRDRVGLHRALDFVYAPDYATPARTAVDAAALGRILSRVRDLKSDGRRGFCNEHLPYLSPLYRHLVLGNMTLADGTIRELESVFFGSSALPPPRPAFVASDPREIVVSRIAATSVPIEAGRALRSAVELEITNGTDRTLEYASSFALPEGAWISGFHLRIGGHTERGILAESRAAAWVYRRIVAAQRDPGLLQRQQNGRFGIRIFPCAAREKRTAGFEIVHREPLLLRIDGKEILLGAGRTPVASAAVVRSGGGEIHYVPPAVKQSLPAVTRTPILHVLVDCSVAAASRRAELIRRIGRFLAENRLGTSPVCFTLVDSGVTSFARDEAWEQRVREHKAAGGFNLGRGVKTILRRHFEARGSTYPILIVVTDALQDAVVSGGLSDLSFTSPESDAFFLLGPSGTLATCRFNDPGTPVPGGVAPWRKVTVLAYPNREHPLAYLADDGRGSVVITESELIEPEAPVAASPWENALALEGLWRALQLDPVGRSRKEFLIVRKSLAAGILTPATTFIALEVEAQKQALLARQRRTLGTHGALDVDEGSFEQMPEPGWLPLIGVLAIALALKARHPLLRILATVVRDKKIMHRVKWLSSLGAWSPDLLIEVRPTEK